MNDIDDIVNIKNFDLNNIKIDEESYKQIIIYYIGYVTITDLNYVKIDIVNLVPTNESKEIIKQYEEL